MANPAKPLTLKQAKFVKAKVAGKTNRGAAQEATGASEAVAAVQANRMLKNVNVQEAIAAEFEKQGITMAAIVKPIADGLTATKMVVMGKDSDDSFVDMTPDHSVRLKASSMAAQFMGIGKQASDITINFIGQSTEQRTVYDIS